MEKSRTQQDILKSKEANIMVSASAGCGKTTAMIGRIVNLIVNEKIELKNMLIVTYTNAAAADIKEKLYISLKQAAAESPFVLKQLNYLDRADISTLHAFCSKILKSYFYEVNIEPKFEVLEDSAAKCLKIKALNKVLKNYYEIKDNAFSQLMEILSLNRSVSLMPKVIINLQEYSQCFFDKELFKKVCLKVSEIKNNEVLKFVNDYIAEFSQNAVQKLNDLYGRALLKSHKECILDCINVLKCLNPKNTLENNLEILSLLNFPSISALKKEEKENFLVKDFHDEFKTFKKQLTDSLKSLKNKYPPFDEKELITYADNSKNLIEKLLSILEEFENEYKLIKTENCGLDFSDLERYTVEILKNKDILEELHNKCRYVFIDECQDINEVQDCIISMLAPKNLFSVGDVKQCIYRFRGAKPEIFINKCEGLFSNSLESFFRLGENYRTSSGLLEFINQTFAGIMFKEFSLVNYKDTENLMGKNKGRLSDGFKSAVVDIVEKKLIEAEEDEDGGDIDIYSVEDDETVNGHAEQEGILIAKRIKELVENNIEILDDEKYLKDNFRDSKISYKDICILVRGKKGFSEKIFLTIKKTGIPISAEFKYPVREYEEIEELIQYLFLIDNFYQDIPLLSVLKSAFHNFSDRELSLIKLKNDKDFHLCFFEYALNGTDAKLKSKISKFIENLNKYRKFSEFNTVSALLELIITENKYEAKLLETLDGPNKVSRVNAFIADLYEKIYEQNLYTFIQFINNFSDEIKISNEISGDCVKINTIHQSKGLEYPVVILAGNQNKFNFKSAYETLLYHPEYGLAFKDYDLTKRTVANTPVYQGLSQLIKYEQIKEELNILYVAMTRARYRLYITGTLDIDKIKCAVTKFDIKNSLSPINLLKVYGELKGGKHHDLFKHSNLTEEKIDIKGDFVLQDKPIDINLEKIINSKYEFSDRLNTPFKLSVTEASKSFAITEPVYNIERVFKEDLTETGNLYHKILQNIDFNAKTDEAIQKELLRLKLIGIAREKLIEQNIDVKSIKRFLNSKLLDNLEGAKIYRERPFMISVPYNKIRGNSIETVLVQGKIDLLIVKNNFAIIVDYKVSRKDSGYLLDKYKEQLNIYAEAVKQILGIENVETYIYSVLKGEMLAVG